MAVRAIRWPGRANLFVSLVAIHNGVWKGKHSLDGRDVDMINAFFEESAYASDPLQLADNDQRLYQGSIFRGDGFLLTHEKQRHSVGATHEMQRLSEKNQWSGTK